MGGCALKGIGVWETVSLATYERTEIVLLLVRVLYGIMSIECL